MKHAFLAILSVAIFTFTVAAQIPSEHSVGGTVKDQNGDVVAGASVTLRNRESRIGFTIITSRDGTFSFERVQAGEYTLSVLADGFSLAEQSVQLIGSDVNDLSISLSVGESHVTVTAETGQSLDVRNVPQPVNIISTEAIAQRVTSALAQAGAEEAGLNVQRTSPTIGAIVIRGLTGKNVVNFVDGVRFTNGAQRGGINTFFDLNEPTNLQAIEVLRGPAGAQYGSDSLAGTVNLVTKSPVYGGRDSEFHGNFSAGYNSADRGFGSSGLLSYGTRKFGGYVSLAGRRIGNLRTAKGLDSHSAITRFLGLPSSVLYDRNPDTGFNQYGGSVRLNYAPGNDQELIFHYQRSQQDDGKRFDQLLGGDGNLIADLRNLMLDFGYLRYVKQKFGPFDSAAFTVSYNSQREERVNQGGQGNPFGDVTHQYERTSSTGFSFFLDKQLPRNNTFLVGGDFYHERVNAPAYIQNPVTRLVTISRPRVPDEAKFDSGGLFIQDAWQAIPERLRISGALRYSAVHYEVRAADSPIVSGRSLWSDDSLKTGAFSGRIGAVVRVVDNFRVAFNYGRGFRYPNITDLGTLGLTGDGFEVDYLSAINLGGTIGSTADDKAISTGLPVAKQRSEVSNNYDVSLRYQRHHFDTEFTVFRLDIDHAITKQSLILPQGAQSIGGQPIVSQLSNGVVFVALASNPVLVRSNFTSAELFGVEYEVESKLTTHLTFKGNFTYIHAEDKASGFPPNIEGGTPPPTGFLSLRYDRSRFWIEPYARLAAKQDRFSSLDLSDRRTGAPRSRSQIQNFFRRGACVRGLTTPGSTGICGSGGGILTATGETQLQVQDRLLSGLSSSPNTSVPLFTSLPSYGLANVRGGFTINEKANIFLAFENIFDQAYRNASWGIDGAGRSFTAQFRYKF